MNLHHVQQYAYLKTTTLDSKRTQLFCLGTLLSHVFFHHVTWYTFLSTSHNTLQQHLRAGLQMVLKQEMEHTGIGVCD